MSYTVPNVQLVPQDLNNACWYASTQMVIGWRRRRTLMSEIGIFDPSEVAAAVQAHKANNGLLWAAMRRYAQMVGLEPLPLMSPTPELLEQWLRRFGPLWTDGVPVGPGGKVVGTGHVVVIAGVRTKDTSHEILVYDPWPPGVGNVSWRPYSHLAGILSDGANPNRDTFFMRVRN